MGRAGKTTPDLPHTASNVPVQRLPSSTGYRPNRGLPRRAAGRGPLDPNLHQPHLPRAQNRLRPIARIEFRHQRRDVVLHRPFGQMELRRDLLVAATVAQ